MIVLYHKRLRRIYQSATGIDLLWFAVKDIIKI